MLDSDKHSSFLHLTLIYKNIGFIDHAQFVVLMNTQHDNLFHDTICLLLEYTSAIAYVTVFELILKCETRTNALAY
jgi:hypothetical protein